MQNWSFLIIFFTCVTENDFILGVAIPSDIHLAVELESPALFALIVEKDAIFQKLNEKNALEKLQPFILITVIIMNKLIQFYLAAWNSSIINFL